MKKLISILIAVALLTTLMVSAFAADTDGATLTIDTVTAKAGDTVTLSATMSATTYAGYGVTLVYDKTALELVSIDKGAASLGFFYASTNTGTVTDVAFDNTAVEGVIFTATFKVLDTAAADTTYEVGLNVDGFNLIDETPVDVTVVSGGIAVEAEPLPTVTVGSAEALVGETVTLDVTVSGATYAGYGVKVVYDNTALELVSIDKGEQSLGFFYASTNTGTVTDVAFEDTYVEGVIFTVTFKVLTDGEHTVSLEIDGFNHIDESVVEMEAVSGTVSVAHVCSFGDWYVETPATCTEDGVERRDCACGEYETRVIEATGHTFGDWYVETPATCTEDGVERRDCACGEHETRAIEATGHTYGEWYEVTPATCTEDGEERRDCACGEHETRVIEATGHTYVDGVCHCSAEDPNPGTGSNIMALALIATVSLAAVVVTATKKSEEE